jgi:mycothiol synthase
LAEIPGMTTAVPVRCTAFAEATDWDDLHDLVVDGYRRTRRWRNWTPDRIDGYLRGRLYDEVHGGEPGWRGDIGLWRLPNGDLVAAVHPEDPDEAYMEVAPGWERLEPDLLAFAEARWMERHHGDVDPPPLLTYASHDDGARAKRLSDRGYRELGPREILWGLTLPVEPPSPPSLDGYRVRLADLTAPEDRRGLIEITRIVFGVSFDADAIDLEAWMRTDREYLVAATEDGKWAAWCGVWSSPEISVGQFEPVGTHPAHRRRGLASAVMVAGMRWMVERGLHTAFVGTGYHSDVNHLYEALGFVPMEILHQWAWLPREGQ